MSELAVKYIDNESNPVTEEAVAKLICRIRQNKCRSAWLALDEYGEEDFLSFDMDNGWAALAFNTWGENGNCHMYQPVNSKYDSSDEYAPVYIGGQTPVLKKNALDNLDLAAECVLCFAKTGRLYPKLKWEEAE